MARIYLYPDAGQALVIYGEDERFDRDTLEKMKAWLAGDLSVMALTGHDVEVRHA